MHNFEALAAPFHQADLSWRILRKSKKGDKAQVVAYVDGRAVMDRLDAIVGPENWSDTYAPGPDGGITCSLSIWIDGRWVTKMDGAENTDIEAVKGGLSDAFKRAAVKWGIGRYLYSLPSPYVPIDQYGNFTPPRLPAWATPSNKQPERDIPQEWHTEESPEATQETPAVAAQEARQPEQAAIPAAQARMSVSDQAKLMEKAKEYGIKTSELAYAIVNRPATNWEELLPMVEEWLSAEPTVEVDGRTVPRDPESLAVLAKRAKEGLVPA